MRDSNKVVRFRRQKKVNIGIIVFLIMFIYIAINVYIYFTKEHISIYEVQEGSTAQDNLITGLVLRDEKLVNTNTAGYITYYQKDGARVSKNAPVFSVNDSKQLTDMITSGEVPVTLTKENNAQMLHTINIFQKTFSDDQFSKVYSFKEDAQSTVLDIMNSTILQNGQAIADDTGINTTTNVANSGQSGIVTYYKDSFENITPDTVTKEMFNKDKYKKVNLRSTNIMKQNSPVYKIITSEEWSIVLPLTTSQYKKLVDKSTISFTIMDNDYQTSAKLSLIQKGDSNYAVLTMNQNMSNYIEDRYLDVKLDFNSADGLKIPVSSVVEKDFYVVPLKYFTTGGDSGSTGLVKETYSNNGEVKYAFVPADIYYQDDKNGYVDANLFPIGTSISKTGTSGSYKLTKLSKLSGVYNVNAGYSVFKRIDILYKGKDYYIVDKNTPNGLSAYDHIALDGKTAVEEQIIY